ncbi:MAG: LamG domain-containing protein, partial [Dehalococcoidales bacterium]|nr:LamG domain-containing protein [Dehalococcoidales bacterium]
ATNSNFALGVSSDSKIAGFTRNGVTAVEFKGDTINTGQWYYFTLVKQGTTHQLYLNGSASGSAVNYTLSNQPSSDSAAIGQDTFSGSRFWDGIMDEVQVSDIARTADWIITSYRNQVNPGGFYTLGPEQNAPVLPTVTTNAATLEQETTATLNGHLDSDGGEACEYAFEWGTVPGVYTANISWTGSINTGANFNHNLIGLVKGQPYYYRAMVKNTAGVAYGGEIHFLTKPDGPTILTATANSTSRIDLTWVKGAGAQRTMIRRSTVAYPATYNDGDQVYYDTGTSFSDTGLTDNTTFYYRAWSEVTGSQQFSNTFTSDSATTFAAPHVSPSIIGGKVYSVNKAAVLLPWIIGSLVSAFILLRVFFYVRKRIQSRQPPRKIAPFKSKPPA